MKTPLEQFREICRANAIPTSEYQVVPGFYRDTIGVDGTDFQKLPTVIALAYIDCDLYSSTMIVLEFIIKRLKHGMIIAFDDYFCYSSSALAGERKAMLELLDSHERFRLLPYVQYGWHGMSFIVEDRALYSASLP